MRHTTAEILIAAAEASRPVGNEAVSRVPTAPAPRWIQWSLGHEAFDLVVAVDGKRALDQTRRREVSPVHSAAWTSPL
jgi:hypothetical protein